jgi:hypothetical protein
LVLCAIQHLPARHLLKEHSRLAGGIIKPEHRIFEGGIHQLLLLLLLHILEFLHLLLKPQIPDRRRLKGSEHFPKYKLGA